MVRSGLPRHSTLAFTLISLGFLSARQEAFALDLTVNNASEYQTALEFMPLPVRS